MQANGIGPATRQRLTRTVTALCAILGLAAVLILTSQAPSQTALGLGIAFPGAGFWPGIFEDGGLRCLGAPAWVSYLGAALICHLLFAFAVIFWFGAGNILAPLVVWVTSAIVAALTAPPIAHAPPAALLITPFLIWLLIMLVWLAPQRKTNLTPIPARPKPFTDCISTELAQQCRFALDRALQPVDAFDGFQFVDQFQTAATRYQIAQTSYALALMNAHLPAFRGYLHKAQVNLIKKQTDHRIWRYWQYENLWGNLDTNPDPVARDNIMYTGFLAAQIALFQSVSGDMRFQKAGSLCLAHKNGQRFSYDQNSLVNALYHGWDASPFHLMPCEPNWVYPLCNAIGGAAALSHTPEAWQKRAPSFRKALEAEFRTPSGAIVPFRSAHLGLAAPPVGGAVVEAYPVTFWNTLFPDLAAELWGHARTRAIKNGKLQIRRFWKVDTGDYRFSRAASLAGFAAAAAEMGDSEARDLALAQLDAECPANSQNWHRPKASVFSHMTELMARLNPGGGLAQLFTNSAHTKGPCLETMDYDQVTVLAAKCQNGTLHLHLSGTGPVTLPLSGFPPNAHLECNGQKTTSDLEGRAEIALSLDTDTKLNIVYAS